MMFKDETAFVAKKAEKQYEALAMQISQPGSETRRQRISVASNSGSSPSIHTETNSRALTHCFEAAASYFTSECMIGGITPSIEEQAMGFFISNYVSQPALVPRGQYEWVLEALSQPDCEEVLRSSAKAACLAGLANSVKSHEIMARAHTAYGSALRMTNNALSSKETAVKDSTLISIIMLGMYENFVFNEKRSIQAWAKHVEGASALLNLRGKKQFKSDIARRIFHNYYGVILLVSLEAGQKVPDGMQELYDHCNPSSDYAVHGRQWTTRLTHFMHNSINLNRDGESDPVALVTKAFKLDHELDRIKALIPGIWRYEVVQLLQPSEHVYGTFYHVYMDPWIAQMWNNLRSCRMYLYRVIREQSWKGCACEPPLFTKDEAGRQVAAAEEVIRTTTAAICASAPQLTGMVDFPKLHASQTSSLYGGMNLGVSRSNDVWYNIHPPGTFLDPARPTGMHHLIWPLYAAGTSDLSSNEMRHWVINMLYFIALRIGTRQAIVLADNLKEMQGSTLQ